MPESSSRLKSAHSQHSLRWAIALSATFTCALGTAFFWTYLPRYFVSIGWTSTGIGFVLAVAMLFRTFAMPTWARMAERLTSTSRMVQIISTVGAVALWALPFVRTTWEVYLVFCLVYATWNSILPLTDALTVRQLGSSSFGRVRAWGSVGYGVAALGVAIAGSGHEHAVVAGWAPWIVACIGTVGAVSTWTYPRNEIAARAPDLPDAFAQLRRPILMWLMPLWAIHWASQAPFNLFLVFLCEDRGMGGWVPGVAVAAGIVAEVIVLAFGARVVAALGPRRLFGLALGLTGLRWCATGLVTDPFALVALQAVHGLSFGGFLLSAMAVLDREIPSEVRASGQALMYVLVFGGGGALGNALAGMSVDSFGAANTFVAAGIVEFIALAALFAVPRKSVA